ncbi:MAG TPA: RtcB family protein [Deltaproteobacteria bacterium]|nr:RtcB family protein [Deltaproteobacteria bacterium]HPP79348.1 RtcB family protein [Deltaproteobacteria bacterium]
MPQPVKRRIDEYRIEIERVPPMRSRGLVYANRAIERTIEHDNVLQQVVNVACLPGIIGPSIAMPDIHWGYGFPIGGVAAFSLDEGVISPGGVGYDINCGVGCILTGLEEKDAALHTEVLLAALFNEVPSGVGSKGGITGVTEKEFRRVLEQGAGWAVRKGYLPAEDLDAFEDGGCIPGADPDAASARAYERGMPQLGTLGSGNHFLELDVVQEIHDRKTAEAFGLFEGQVVVLVHTGSRGFGHQVCDEYVRDMIAASARYGIDLPDRQLACAPVRSREGREYLGAMAASANFAFANRAIVAYLVRRAFERVFGLSFERLGMRMLVDCCHNVAKVERVEWEGRVVEACIHRKGATRALPAGDVRLPARYAVTGQPVLVPGDMGRMSFILCALDGARETFFSACHGAGRLLSRHEAKRVSRGRKILDELRHKGIRAMAASKATLAEEIPDAYKDVSDVVDTVSGAGIARPVARLRPFAMVKG